MSVDIERTFYRQILAIDVLVEMNRVAGQILEHDNAVVGRDQKRLTFFVENLRPKQMTWISLRWMDAIYDRPNGASANHDEKLMPEVPENECCESWEAVARQEIRQGSLPEQEMGVSPFGGYGCRLL